MARTPGSKPHKIKHCRFSTADPHAFSTLQGCPHPGSPMLLPNCAGRKQAHPAFYNKRTIPCVAFEAAHFFCAISAGLRTFSGFYAQIRQFFACILLGRRCVDPFGYFAPAGMTRRFSRALRRRCLAPGCPRIPFSLGLHRPCAIMPLQTARRHRCTSRKGCPAR